MRPAALNALALACLPAPADATHAAGEKGPPVPIAGAAADCDAPPGSAACSLAPRAW